MYKFASNIVIRFCLNKAFLINIHTNMVIMLSYNAMNYLIDEIKKGLSEETLSKKEKEFSKFVYDLTKKGVLEVCQNEI